MPPSYPAAGFSTPARGSRLQPDRGGGQSMTQPTLEDARTLSEWRPPLGVLSIYLAFDPADRGGAWRTELRNGLDSVLEAQQEAEHARRVALRATARRLTERFEDGDLRPPPRGEVGFVE